MAEILMTISAKGQITVPAEVRRVLGVKPRDKIAFVVENGDVRIKVARSLADSYQAVPALKHPMSLQEMMAAVKEEHALHVAQEGLPTSGT